MLKKRKIEDIAHFAVGLTVSEIKKLVFYEYEFMNKKKVLLYKLKKDVYEKILKGVKWANCILKEDLRGRWKEF